MNQYLWAQRLDRHPQHDAASLLEPLARATLRRLLVSPDTWGYLRIHGELALLGVAIAASTVWETLKTAGIDPAPRRTSVTWADFLRS